MTLRFPALLFFVFAILIPGCAQDGPPASTVANGPWPAREPTTEDGVMPALSPGDSWTTSSQGKGVRVTVHVAVERFEDHAGIPTYRTASESNTTVDNKAATANSTTWYRASDQANVEVRTTNRLTYQGRTYNATSTVVFDPPCPTFQWPLAIGSAWERTCTAIAQTSDGAPGMPITSHTSYLVEAFERVTVPAGTFDAFRIRIETDGSDSGFQWVSRGACGVVKAVAGGASNQLTSELQSFQCIAKSL